MRIAIVCNDYAPTVGGVQTAVRNIALHSQRAGHTVTILTAQPSDAVPAREEIDGVVVHRFAWQRRPLPTWPARAARTVCAMRRVLDEFRPDLVYVHFLTINALYVLLLHYRRPFRLVVSARGNDVQGLAQHSHVQRWMLRQLFRRADAVLFCSSYLQSAAQSLLRSVPARTFVGVVGDGFDPGEFAGRAPYRHPRPYVLAMGRLVEKKGFDMLVRAFASMAMDYPRHDLLIAGDGEERAKLERLIGELQMQSRIHLLGFADRQKTISLFLGCEFFALSSRLEPFGIVVLEALAAGRPVLATRSGGVVELIEPGVNGLLVAADAGSLAEGLRRMLRDPPCVPATAQNRTWAAVTDEFLAVFQRVLETRV
jgi:glycosyltransferase involved in cell wall biosynthesis